MGTEFEHKLGLIDAFRQYPKAVGWSILVSTACVMEGYDTAFIVCSDVDGHDTALINRSPLQARLICLARAPSTRKLPSNGHLGFPSPGVIRLLLPGRPHSVYLAVSALLLGSL